MRANRKLVLGLFGLTSPFWLFFGSASLSHAQLNAAPRVRDVIRTQQSMRLQGSVSPHLASMRDIGVASDDLTIPGVSIHFGLTPEQRFDLDRLTRDQQTPGSARYHRWISPEEYAQQYGVGEVDLALIEAWLQSEGFSHFILNRSRSALHFDGTSRQFQRVFGATLHNYAKDGHLFVATATELRIPAALSNIVEAITGID